MSCQQQSIGLSVYGLQYREIDYKALQLFVPPYPSISQKRYTRSKSDDLKKKMEASAYREKINQTRTDKLSAVHEAWKSKQVKRRKPEESDDTEERFAYNSHVAQQQLIQSIQNYHI